MKLVEIRDETGLEKLRPAWDRLLGASESANTFLTWEWVTAWWCAYGNPGELRILTAVDDDGTLRGIAPLRARIGRRYGQKLPVLSFIGDGSNDSDYLDFILARGYEDRVMAAFQRRLAEEMEQGTILELNEIPAESAGLSRLRELGGRPRILWNESDVPCAVVALPESWDAYLNLLKPRFRTKVRSVLRHLESRPEVRCGFCQTPEEIERLLPALFDLHTRRWKQDGKPGVFGWDPKRRFYAGVSPLLLQRDWLRFSWLEWNGRVLACQYGFEYAGTYFHLQEGYEPEAEHWNVGIGLRAWSIRELLQRGVRRYDFLGGVGRHKTDWGAEVRCSRRIQAARESYRNVIYCRGPEWEARARESIRRLVPGKLLQARAAWYERRSEPADGNGAAAKVAGSQIRRAVANGYVHSCLPAIMRRIRGQYQLTVSSNDISSNRDGRKVAFGRRRETSARILCYHRINDDRDAFFPAISTDVFEKHMQHLAKHHKVVGLTELLDRLARPDSGESLLAITFDDGYQDNFRNAFPILQRYGLPATIFLTTGSIDSREPLWFEQLSQAFKHCSREVVDLELDIPRRFRLGSTAGRLDANRGTFRFLRSLPDAERREKLARILRELDCSSAGERIGKMLTWDEVRQMQAHRIEFGGHTVTHAFLSRAGRDQVCWEVSECKRRIEAELQAPVKYFAYPNGQQADIESWNKEVLRSAGYRAAVTTIWGMNYHSTDPLELRRGGPWEELPALFAWKLDCYQMVND